MGQQSVLAGLKVRGAVAVASIAFVFVALTGCAATTASGEQNTDPLPTATVEAPNGGSVDETVAPLEPGATETVGIEETATLSDGVQVRVASAESLDVDAETPGEIAGPAVAVTLEIVNGTDAAIDLSTTMVSVLGADGSLGQPTTSTPFAPFLTSLEPGESATAVYVFLLPANERNSLNITVEYLAGAPIALFAGNVD